MGLWDRYAVPAIVSSACATKPVMRQRTKVVPRASGVVLEIGCGSGNNFSLYEPDQIDKVFALEPAEEMRRRAQERIEGAAIEPKLELMAGDAHDLPMENDTVDSVVLTFVLCTIPDAQRALAEARRVLRPGGKVVFCEHGLAPDPGVARWQRRIEPVWKRLGGGCHLTRDVGALLRGAGFTLEGADTRYMPKTPKFAGYVTWGQATPG